MSSPTGSIPCSPTSSSSSLRADTPVTERSVLFDDHPIFDDEGTHILVTGGLGFIGSHTSLELLKAGYNVVIVDDLSNAFRSVFDRIQALADRFYAGRPDQCPSMKLYDINYRDVPAMRRLLEEHAIINSFGTRPQSRIGGVIHFAAFKAVAESIKQPLKYYSNNVSGLVDFMGLLDEYSIKNFIFSSSATVYGTLADKGEPLREEHCVHRPESFLGSDGIERRVEQGCTGLTNPYGRTKWVCEAILADLAISDPDWTIVALRYFNPVGCDVSGLLGEDPKGIPSNLLPVVTKVMTGEYQELSMFGNDWNTPDGTAVRDFIHVTDLARGHIAALAAAKEGSLKESFRTFNLGSGTGHSVMDVVTAMEKASNASIARKTVGRRDGDVGSCVAMADRSANELGWRTEKTLDDACRDICNFLKVSAS